MWFAWTLAFQQIIHHHGSNMSAIISFLICCIAFFIMLLLWKFGKNRIRRKLKNLRGRQISFDFCHNGDSHRLVLAHYPIQSLKSTMFNWVSLQFHGCHSDEWIHTDFFHNTDTRRFFKKNLETLLAGTSLLLGSITQ